MVFISLQFWFLNKYWQLNAVEALVLSTMSLALTLWWLPESPRFLYGRKRFADCAKVMQKVA